MRRMVKSKNMPRIKRLYKKDVEQRLKEWQMHIKGDGPDPSSIVIPLKKKKIFPRVARYRKKVIVDPAPSPVLLSETSSSTMIHKYPLCISASSPLLEPALSTSTPTLTDSYHSQITTDLSDTYLPEWLCTLDNDSFLVFNETDFNI